MKKIFLSLPMSGRSNAAIQDVILAMKSLFLLKNDFEGEEIEFVDNSECLVAHEDVVKCKTKNLLYLSGAIYKMSFCDAVLFGPGYQTARGCKVEFDTALYYGIPIYAIDKGEIRKLDKCEITKDMVWDYTEDEKEHKAEHHG